jgi:hypothetical protein
MSSGSASGTGGGNERTFLEALAVIEMRRSTAADLPALDQLFREGFGHGLSAAEWRWKYEELPGEARSLVAVNPAGAVVAHAGVLRLAARWRGGTAGIWHCVDFVGVRRGSGLRPPMLDLGLQIYADLPRPTDVPWMFGFASERHHRLGKRMFGYGALPVLEPLTGALPAATGVLPAIAVSDHCDESVDAIWEACADYGVVRDARFYRLRSGGEEGLAVFGFVGSEAQAAELWLPPGGDWHASLLAVAADLRAMDLASWRFFPPSSDATGRLLDSLGLRGSGERLHMSCRSAPGDDPEALAAGFPYAMGDYDVV